MPWFKVDDKLHDHRKSRVARKSAMGVWVLAGSWCADNLTEGFVPTTVLPRWGTGRDASALVSAGLWHPDEQDGEPGWRFHDWSDFQPSRAYTEEQRAIRAEAGRKGGRASGEARRQANTKQVASPTVQADAKQNGTPVPVPVPVPSVVDVVSQVSVGDARATGLDKISSNDLEAIAAETGPGDLAWAERVAVDVLSRATGPPRRPVAYVLHAVSREPARYRRAPRPPKPDEQCGDHPGQWAGRCAGCAADKAASA